MDDFYASNECPVCGRQGASYKFHGPDCEQFGHEGEHMHRQCAACGHQWPERARQALRAVRHAEDH
jgi:DNA-directed RNA polymerase subunit M/transcription elongation factor TFIIS